MKMNWINHFWNLTCQTKIERLTTTLALIVFPLSIVIVSLWRPILIQADSLQPSLNETFLDKTLQNDECTSLRNVLVLIETDLGIGQTDEIPLELAWTSVESDQTSSVAWGDYDGDGDLDLAIGNTFGRGQANRLYRNDSGLLTTEAVWVSDETDYTADLAWGDYDGDGDFDLAVGNGYMADDQCNRLYRNDNGTLTSTAVWSSVEQDETSSVAWGDYDNDGDLDLGVGNSGQANRLYRNDNGLLTPEAVWSTTEEDDTSSIAWGDYDQDGDLDLLVGNREQPNRLYRNDDGALTVVWSSVEQDETSSVAWGDYDNDGDLDFGVGNEGVNYLYENMNGTIIDNPAWLSIEEETTATIAWGDYDSDGDLDLAVGNNNGRPNQIYRNDDGVLTTEAVWASNENDHTDSLAWGDYDGDGDLDLVAGNNGGSGQPNRLYRNDSPKLTTTAVWSSTQAVAFTGLAWGDHDNDGDLDLATGDELHRNDNDTLTTNTIWQGSDLMDIHGIAWGDYDNDTDLDLAVSHGNQANRLYANDEGVLNNQEVWSSTEVSRTHTIAWGDYDSDGDLDLAVGNIAQPNQLYRNDDGILTSNAVWTSEESDHTYSLAWGDYDSDGDLDLVVGNDSNQPNRLYLNENGSLTTTAVWSSGDTDWTRAVVWGDYDGDSDLDLAVGNFNQPIRLYRNDEGILTTNAVWSSQDRDWFDSLAWRDYDSDGDLDIVADTWLYRNDGGIFTNKQTWTPIDGRDAGNVGSVAWGDYDNDGDLDLAMGPGGIFIVQSGTENLQRQAKGSSPLHIYHNKGRQTPYPTNSPPYVVVARPGNTAAADFYSTPHIIQEANIPIDYTLFDSEGDTVSKIIPEYSANGGGHWLPATSGPGGDGQTNLAASATGTPHTFVWAAAQDIIKSDNVVFRIRAQPPYSHGPILWSALGGQSLPFRVESPWAIKVVDHQNNPVAGATVYANGQPITTTVNGVTVTNKAGLLNPGSLDPGTALVVLAQQAEQPATRGEHDGWAYRTYVTNIGIDAQGNPDIFTVPPSGQQLLVVRPENTLILFNIVVSVEWDATQAYLEDLHLAMDRAADFLYDVSDGQMTFGEVSIYDNAEHWTDADIQISAKNIVHPHAYIGGIFEEDTSDLIRLGRFWNGITGNEGAWSEPDGYRTIVHELGHYALKLFDEYFGYEEQPDGQLGGREDTFCMDIWRNPDTGEIINLPDPERGASIMHDHYLTSEFADRGRWTDWCQRTAQHQLNNGEADWETIQRIYNDPSGQDRWRLISPDERAGLGQVVSGPEVVPTALPFPFITFENSGDDPEPVPMQVCYNGLPYSEGGWVTLHNGEKAIDQGLTDANGLLDIFGTRPGDTLQIISQDGTLSASAPIPLQGSVELTADPPQSSKLEATPLSVDDILELSNQRLVSTNGQTGPYLRMWPTTSNQTLDGMRLTVTRTSPDDNLVYALTGPDDVGPAGAIQYQDEEDNHQIKINFIPPARAGHARVLGFQNGQLVDINVDYRLQQTDAISDTDLFSNDGNLKLHLDLDSLPLNQLHFLIASPWGLPGPPPPGLDIIGEAYEITASDTVDSLVEPGVLRFRYDSTEGANFENKAIYRWDFATSVWQLVGGEEPNKEHQEVVTTITDLGLYALMGNPINSTDVTSLQRTAVVACSSSTSESNFYYTYLPVVIKN